MKSCEGFYLLLKVFIFLKKRKIELKYFTGSVLVNTFLLITFPAASSKAR